MDPPHSTGSVTRTFSLSKQRIVWLFYQHLALFNVCTEIVLADNFTPYALRLREPIWYWWFGAMDGGSLWASVGCGGWRQHLQRPLSATDFCMIATLPLRLFQAPVWPGDDLGCIKTVPAQLEDTVTSMKYLDRDISFFPTSHLQCRHKGQHRKERVWHHFVFPGTSNSLVDRL